jgi:hypothetical protein
MIGEWTYTAPTAPIGYQEGEIHISKSEQDNYEVYLVLGQYKIAGKNIKVEDDKLMCLITVEESYIDLLLTFKEDALSGNANTPDGVVMIEGVRKK